MGTSRGNLLQLTKVSTEEDLLILWQAVSAMD